MTDIYESQAEEWEAHAIATGPATKNYQDMEAEEAMARESKSMEGLRVNPLNDQMPSSELYAYGEAENNGVNLQPLDVAPGNEMLEQAQQAQAEGEEGPTTAPEPEQDVQLPNRYFKPGAMTLAGQDLATGEQQLSVAPEPETSWFDDVVIGGGIDAIKGVIDLRSDIGDMLGLPSENLPMLADLLIKDVPAGDSLTRTIPRALMQFTIPYLGAAKMVGAARAAGVARFGKEMIASGAATQVFDPEDGTLATLIKAQGWDQSAMVQGIEDMGLPVEATLQLLDSEYQHRVNGVLAGRVALLAEDSVMGLVVPALFKLGKLTGSTMVDAYKGADFKAMGADALLKLQKSSTSLKSGADPTDMVPMVQLAMSKMGQGMNSVETWFKAFEGDVYTLKQKSMAYANGYKELNGKLPYSVDVDATHYSRTEGLESLSADKYGTGVKGADLARDASPRVYFYHGDFQKEMQLGNIEYKWKQENVYDFKADPLKFGQIARDELTAARVADGSAMTHVPAPEVATRKEELIKEAGYSGFIISEAGPGARKTRSAGVSFGDVDLSPPLAERMPRVNRTGQYVGVPAGINTPEKFDAWMDGMGALVDEGIEAKNWYGDSAKAIFRAAGGNPQMAEKLSMMLAITSQGASVKQNTGYALKAWYQHINGLPVDVGRFLGTQGPKIQAILDGQGAEWIKGEAGRKTATFHNNLMVELDLEKYKEKGLVTNDMWVARAAGLSTDAFSPQQYESVERAIEQIAKTKNITPHQAQASLWTSIRGKYQATSDLYKSEGIRKNILKMDGTLRKGMKIKARELQRKIALGAPKMNPKQFSEAAYNFSNAFEENYAQISLEAIPSTSTEFGAMMSGLPLEAKAEYTQAIYNVLLDDTGMDVVAKALGIPQGAVLNGPGFWQGVSNPSIQVQVPVPTKSVPMIGPDGVAMTTKNGKPKFTQMIDDNAKVKLDEYAEVMATLMDQDAVGYHRPIPAVNHAEANGVRVGIGAPLSPDQMEAMGKIISEKFGDEVALIVDPLGVRLLNFSKIDNVEWQNDIMELLPAMDFLPDTKFSRFKSDGNLKFQNKEKYYGTGNRRGIPGGTGSNVLGGDFDVLAEQIAEVNARYYEQYFGTK